MEIKKTHMSIIIWLTIISPQLLYAQPADLLVQSLELLRNYGH